ncbi:double-strand break repair protein AddB [Falsihalocynthiibacter sp. BN13B15]|uniref:double-strand break repair protein AddB n=1 Tax=Falsihalocynthiibacter sp. BN13B15 TaxID=3240871 RepID=UPI00350FA509
MFKPNIYGIAPGCDFPAVLVHGLLDRYRDKPPEELARVQLVVNTERMKRRVVSLFAAQGAILCPKIGLVTDLAFGAAAGIEKAVSPLRRRLELTQLIAQLLDQQPDLAARDALYDLADSLATLMDEMHGEGVEPCRISSLDVSDQSGHWARSLEFIGIVDRYFDNTTEPLDKEARQRLVIEALISSWQDNPPKNPIILAGSTGSRGATHKLMRAIAELPNGAVVLPGFDFDMPAEVWSGLDDALTAEDHPQYRFHHLLQSFEVTSDSVSQWSLTPAPSPERNALISLALRPAPVTDQWMSEGKHLPSLASACENVTLVEASSSREEAGAIALRLREAVDKGQKAALITPDRVLTRQVTAALSQWKIEPDDSAGTPLALSAPGRFLRHISALMGQKLTSEALLTLLKHPLTNTGSGQRGAHLKLTRELELKLRRFGPPHPHADDLQLWASTLKGDENASLWAEWIIGCLFELSSVGTRSLSEQLDFHLAIAERLANGPAPQHQSQLWLKKAGESAHQTVETLKSEAGYGGDFAPRDYVDLFRSVLDKEVVRDPIQPHPNIMIWGTLEARVQGADLVILAGLNEGVWPETPKPDPWLNRKMRADAGLLLPERRIGLSAHDFQQAVCAPEVWITRSIRSSESETVPSRWVNRLVNLLDGLPKTGGKEALDQMRRRGNTYLALFKALETPEKRIESAKRPCPQPPVHARPKKLSVTQIKTLIRDPYAVYARHVLRLKPLDPLRQVASAPLRGTVLHSIFEAVVRDIPLSKLNTASLMAVADKILEAEVPWPAAQRIWRGKLGRLAEWFVATEHDRQSKATPTYFEKRGELRLDRLDFTLSGIADRIDVAPDGRAVIYDYKTTPPTAKVEHLFDKQLLLEATMLERGAFLGVAENSVQRASYIGIGSSPEERDAKLEETSTTDIWAELHTLIESYFAPDQGYTSRRATSVVAHYGDYDHLARFGEWEESDAPNREVVS